MAASELLSEEADYRMRFAYPVDQKGTAEQRNIGESAPQLHLLCHNFGGLRSGGAGPVLFEGKDGLFDDKRQDATSLGWR